MSRKVHTNPHRISLKEWLDGEGIELDEACERLAGESSLPALCDEGCMVEPDGECPHGCPTIAWAIMGAS